MIEVRSTTMKVRSKGDGGMACCRNNEDEKA